MNRKIHEILNKQSQKNSSDVEIKLISIIKPPIVQVNKPFIHIDNAIYFYTFDCRRVVFNGKLVEMFFLPDETYNAFIVNDSEEKQYMLTLSSKNKIECHMLGKSEQTVKYTINRNVIDILKIGETVYYAFRKDGMVYINEVAYDGSRFIGKHVYKCTSDCDFKLYPAEKTFLMTRNGIVYNESECLNLKAEYLQVYQNMIFTAFFENGNADNVEKKFRCQIKLSDLKGNLIYEMPLDTEERWRFAGNENIIVAYSEHKMHILKIENGLIKVVDSRKQRDTILCLDTNINKNIVNIYVLLNKYAGVVEPTKLSLNNLAEQIENIKLSLSDKENDREGDDLATEESLKTKEKSVDEIIKTKTEDDICKYSSKKTVEESTTRNFLLEDVKLDVSNQKKERLQHKEPMFVGRDTFALEKNNFVMDNKKKNLDIEIFENNDKLEAMLVRVVESAIVKNQNFIQGMVIKGILPVVESGFNEIRTQLMAEIKNIIYTGKEEMNMTEKNVILKKLIASGNLTEIFLEIKKYNHEEFDNALTLINPNIIKNVDSNVLVDFVVKLHNAIKKNFKEIQYRFLIESLSDIEIKNLTVEKIQILSVTLRYLTELSVFNNEEYQEVNAFIRYIMKKIKKRS